jgi:hypothetical protein
MTVKSGTSALKAAVSNREFEILLRRASELSKPGRPTLVKATQPVRKSPRSASQTSPE